MGKLWTLLKNHVREDFSIGYYSCLCAFLGLGIALNYTLGIETWIDSHYGLQRMALYFPFYAVAYYGGVLLMVLFKGQRELIMHKNFWILSVAALIILSIDGGFSFLNSMLRSISLDTRLISWAHLVGSNIISFFIVCIPVFILYRALPVLKGNLGLSVRAYDVRPYFLIVLILIPIVTAASFMPDFSAYYPVYKSTSGDALDWPAWLPAAIFEFFYGLDFFNVEFLFRGFLVIGMTQVLGRHAIIPMVTTYCFLHFGKPVGEAVSSIVGGYILGVIAFYTRAIWGGVIVHMGLALSMELVAYLQKLRTL